MWIRMPQGTSGISVELREFESEALDTNGFHYFRAPDSLVPKILALPSFAAIQPPADATMAENLPPVADADSAMQAVADQLTAVSAERDLLRDQNRDLAKQNTSLTETLRRCEGRSAELQNEVSLLKAKAGTAAAAVEKK